MLRSIDPELKYCPACKEEYRAEILTCADCGRKLLSGIEMQARLDPRSQGRTVRAVITADDPLTPVRKGPVLMIKALQAYLEQEGLPALTVKEGEGQCATGCRGPELLLLVRSADLPEVMAALEQEHRLSTGLDERVMNRAGTVFDTGSEEAVCPACGFRFSTRVSACPDCGLCFA